MSAGTDSARRRKAAGPDRPSYLTGADTDKVMAIVLALMSEVASLRERLDAHERIAADGTLPSLAAVEAFVPDEAAEGERSVWRKAFIRRLFRVVTEEVDIAKQGTSAPVEDGETE